MKNLRKRLAGRAGFTIVECIIAVAVFAAMTVMVFMILTQARNSAVAANKAEDDLTGMIENVVGDDSYKKFYKDESEVLKLNVSSPVTGGAAPSWSTGEKFTISYNKVSGYKNYIECPECKKSANNIDFLHDSAGNPVRDIAKIKSADTYSYICPYLECNKPVTGRIELKCYDCDKTGHDTDFTLIEGTGGYYCPDCGGTAVMGLSSEEDPATHVKKYVADVLSKENVDGDNSSGFNVSGMYANAIRYGEVKLTGETDAAHKSNNSLITMYQKGSTFLGKGTDTSKHGRISGTLEYTGTQNHSVPGMYTLTLTVNHWADGIVDSETNPETGSTSDVPKKISIALPPYYNVTDVKPSDEKLIWEVKTPDDLSGERELAIGNITANVVTVSFRLTNYRSGFAFEYDYNSADNVQGLFKWFGCPGTYKNPDGYLTYCNGSFKIVHAGYDD